MWVRASESRQGDRQEIREKDEDMQLGKGQLEKGQQELGGRRQKGKHISTKEHIGEKDEMKLRKDRWEKASKS